MDSSSNNSQQPCSSSTDDDYPLLDNQSLEELLRLWADINGRLWADIDGLTTHNMDEEEVLINVDDYLIDSAGDYSWIDHFSTQSLEDVRQFLMHYCRERAEAGYVMVEDPLLTFYKVVDHQYLSQQVPEESGTRLFKSSLAMQRERTGRLKLSDLEAYFHLPIEVAAKKLAICPTVLKKICRKYGMPRWPYRKEQIKSVDRQILSLKVSLREKKGEENALVRAKIETLKQEREQILNGMMAKPALLRLRFCRPHRRSRGGFIHLHLLPRDYTEKLEIHGRVGLISHVVHETKYQVNGLPLVVGHDKIDFSTQSLEDVRQFLMHYCRERAEAGYVMVEDPLLTFYSALCSSNACVTTAEVVHQYLSQQVPVESGTRLFKSSLAMQRERIGRFKLSDLEAYFHLPIEVAAKKLAMCPTVLKKICRKHGMLRWPHRKIKSIDRQILSLRVSLREKNEEVNAPVRAKIETLKQEREQILKGMM
ncbi:hypothetical protein Syun_011626 [Stephania yunnanensis]|uniref:RWP-RK domain-containing protein n=1 Tax=Stephania yunnanensis TaxID=152371 RepID=A0AAP0PIN9_9MAGN